MLLCHADLLGCFRTDWSKKKSCLIRIIQDSFEGQGVGRHRTGLTAAVNFGNSTQRLEYDSLSYRAAWNACGRAGELSTDKSTIERNSFNYFIARKGRARISSVAQ